MMQQIEFHDYANLFPMMTGEELQQLCESMKAGYDATSPIVIYGGKILDGRNRQRAADAIGITPLYREFIGSDKDALDFVIRHNLTRRHMNETQRAVVGSKLANMGNGGWRGNQWQSANLQTANITQAEAATMMNVSPRMVATVKAIEREAPELIPELEAGRMSAHQAQTIISQADNKPHVSFNSGNNEWYTPTEYIEAARRVMGGIDLDPASSDIANKTVKADVYLTAQDDGLVYSWSGRVWMNPPYSGELIGRFSAKLVEHYKAGDISEAIVLVNNATETGWYQGMVREAEAVCFLKGRIKYNNSQGIPENSPLQGQTFLYFGERPMAFASQFSHFGVVLYARR